jgi:2'-5' RNA ligase
MVAIPVPEPHSEFLTGIQNAFRPRTWRVTMGPHITLIPPSRPTLTKADAISAFLSANLPQKPILVKSTQLDQFVRSSRRTLVLRLSPKDPIRALVQRLQGQTKWQEIPATQKHEFVPHITLANQLGPEDADRVLSALAAINLNVAFQGNHVVLYEKESSWLNWQPIAEKFLS